MIANTPMSGSPEKRRDCIVPTALAAVTLTRTPRQVNIALTRRLQSSDGQIIEKLRACSAERELIEIVVRIAHVRVFRFIPDFRRKFRVAAMDVRNFGRQQRLIAVVPNRKRKRPNLNKTGHVARRRASRSLPNAIAGSGGITFRLVDLVNSCKELSRSNDKIRDTAAEFTRRTVIVPRRILNISERSYSKANDRGESKNSFHRRSLAVK